MCIRQMELAPVECDGVGGGVSYENRLGDVVVICVFKLFDSPY